MRIYGSRLHFRGVKALMRERGVRDDLMRRMERVAAQANRNAPHKSGRLGNSHTAYMDDRPSSHLPAARVSSSEDYALGVEAGTGYLSSALDAAGGES